MYILCFDADRLLFYTSQNQQFSFYVHYVPVSQTEELICDLILRSSMFQRTLMLKLLMIYQMILTTVIQNISCGMIGNVKLGLKYIISMLPGHTWIVVLCLTSVPIPHPLDCFWLMFTEELLNIYIYIYIYIFFFARVKLLLPTTHSRSGRQTPQPDISTDGI